MQDLFARGEHGFYSAHARGGSFFFLDGEMPQLARMVRVRPAADFLGEFAHGVNLHALGVAAFEQADSAAFLGLFHGHFIAGDGYVFFYHDIDQRFHFLQLFRRHFAREREIEPQALGGDVAALLGNAVVLQYLTQRGLQKMRCRVQLGGFFGAVRKAALEALLRAGLRFLLVLPRTRRDSLPHPRRSPFPVRVPA